jgi:GT2 family glycosyltransferase
MSNSSMPNSSASILMVCRNGLQLTKRALPTLLNQSGIPGAGLNVLLVNNGSTDGTAAWIKTTYPLDACSSLSMKDPLSVAQVWNMGLTNLFSWSGVSEVLVVNNDVELLPETYRCLRDNLQTGLGILSAVGTSEEDWEGAKETWSQHPYCAPLSVSCAPLSVSPHPDFSCFMIAKWAWQKVGKFDEGFEIAYGEDCDYHVRCSNAGVECGSIGLPFLHHGSGTLKTSRASDRRKIEKQADKNRQYFKQKWGVGIGTPEYYKMIEASLAYRKGVGSGAGSEGV